MMYELSQRFQREVKANGKKAGLLAGLFLFGCCFWIPMAVRAFAPARASAAISPAAAPHSPVTPPANAIDVPAATADADSGKFWSNLSKSLADDPMFQSAEIQTLSRDPFQVAESSEPLPVLFAEEPKPKVLVKPAEKESRPLELSGTIIGKTRSAARINGQLYAIGKQVQSGDRTFLLTKIESHRVELTSGQQTIELTLTRPQLNQVLDRGTPASPPLQ